MDLIDDDNSDTEKGVDKQSRAKLGYDLPGSMLWCTDMDIDTDTAIRQILKNNDTTRRGHVN